MVFMATEIAAKDSARFLVNGQEGLLGLPLKTEISS